jgi:predicted GH43/DUF377 family glycosyl hydrolase
MTDLENRMKKLLSFLLLFFLLSASSSTLYGGRPRFELVPYPPEPLITPGFQGDIDSQGVLSPELLWDGHFIRLYYTAVDSNNVERIALAVSTDLLIWEPAGVVLEPREGTFDQDGVSSPELVVIDGAYHLFYTASSSGWNRIAHVSSPDGFQFSDKRTIVLEPSYDTDRFDSIGVSSPSILYQDSVFYLMYRGHDGSPWRRLGLATSHNGFDFDRKNGNAEQGAFFGRGRHGFDDGGADDPEIWLGSDGTVRMLYTSLHF